MPYSIPIGIANTIIKITTTITTITYNIANNMSKIIIVSPLSLIYYSTFI
jgi:hypothetical protein